MEANYTPHIYNEYKTRNILSLADRVEVIREYDSHLTRPSLQSLAQKFECSSKQIKNILLNRETILQQYNNGEAGPQKESSGRDDGLQKRQEKIAFLGKVIYEYIQRVLYYNYNIDDEKVRQKALQIKECIAVENFQPTYAWLENFKMTYGIPAFDLQSLRNNIVITEAKRPHLSAIDMIQYVSRMEQEEQEQNRNKSFTKVDINGNGRLGNNNNKNHSSNNNNQLNGLEPKIIYEIEDEEQDEELQKLNFSDSPPKASIHNTSSSPAIKYTTKRRASSPFPDIESVDGALKHIKALEEYAMLHDNFRAIGLLTQLEQIFKKQMKKD
ncbi:uncharacterized protein LOC111685599 [Lucilia cuprina]|uniref:uncharacterized protein LOC111685599 n=1 Tax=Lucilia cuprina TaxID=7375 RepID=UPI001F06D0B7|nr:uncharacterized protein LOC111685599 [Lucilia cuprina]